MLTDPTGLHLGAGPYFLIYSRAMSPEEEAEHLDWPADIKVRLPSLSAAGAAPPIAPDDPAVRTEQREA